jgi:diguanylate cyclase (GGDEF)-like protein/PAS domain S-box-containing protein
MGEAHRKLAAAGRAAVAARAAHAPARSREAVSQQQDRAEPRRKRSRPFVNAYGRVGSTAQETQHHIPRNWNRMALFLAAAYVWAAFASLRLPGLPFLALAGISVLLAFCGPRFVAWERRPGNSAALRFFVMLAAVVLPQLLAGIVIGNWIVNVGLDIHWGVATLIAVTAVSAALLNGRLFPMFAGKLAVWSGFIVADRSVFAFAALGGLTVVLILVHRYQSRLNRAHAEKVEARERVRNRAEDILRDYEETGQGWFWETDRRGQIAYVSGSVPQTLGRSETELVGRPFTELFEPGEDNREGERTLSFHLSARSSFQELAVRAAVADEERWWSISGRPIYDGFHNFCGFRGSGTDLTEKKRSQEYASRLAHYDSLTGLANRFQMAQSLEKILAAPQEMHRECSVFLLDLDRFKHVNDTLGHPAGDALLKQVAQRLERTVGKLGLVGRLGGDEFEVIVPGRIDLDRLRSLAHEIIASLSQPYSIEGQRVVIGASVGIALSPENGVTSESLIRNADLALYAAKDGGRGRFHFYANDLHSAAEERGELEQDLRDAIAQGGLELYYQPVVHTATERISGFEALLRWNHPTRGWLSPAKFVPIAEDTGLIAAIGEWAIRTACRDLARWPDDVRCAVNVSPLQFANPNLPAVVTNALAQSGVSPSRLELEITESVFLNDDAGTDAMFAALKGVGVRLALDDFGTGYSSLGYLKKAPFDKIKIDRSFVRGATEPGSRNGAIIASITSLAQALGMDTTAEGVETLDELDLVRMHGCSHVQGFIYEKALSAQAATERLATGLGAVAKGPRSSRAARHTMLRKVILEHSGQHYQGTVRNISATGALIEGLWNVPAGTIFRISLSDSRSVTGTARWCEEDRMGIEFAHPLERDESGTIVAMAADELARSQFKLRRSA